MAEKIVVLGDGGWGTALALLLLKKGNSVSLWGKFPEYTAEMKARGENFKFLPGVTLPENLEFVNGRADALASAAVFVVAIPTQFIRATLKELKGVLNRKAAFLSVAKGVEIETLKRPSEVIADVLGRVELAVLSGPSHAEEVGRGLPANVVLASRNRALGMRLQKLVNDATFRVYLSSDPLGVELGGALKNVIAVAAGICDGLKLGDNAKAALLARGIVEISRVGVAMGARKRTFFGLSGMGDLITTCYSPHGRNLYVGRQIGAGKKLEELLKEMHQVAEGVWTTKAVLKLAKKYRVEIPITQEVSRVLFEGKDPRQAVHDLMSRVPHFEGV